MHLLNIKNNFVGMCVCSVVFDFATCQAPLSMRVSRQEFWSCLFWLQGLLLTQISNPQSPELTDGFFTIESHGKLPYIIILHRRLFKIMGHIYDKYRSSNNTYNTLAIFLKEKAKQTIH